MPRPDRPENLPRMLADLRRRMDRFERRDAFGDKRRVAASAGGLYAHPVSLVAPDASGWYSVTTSGSWTDVAVFAPSAADRLWVVAACNGAGTDMQMRLWFTAGAVSLGSAAFIETHATLGPILRVQGARNPELDKAATVAAGSVVLQAQTANSAVTNKLRILSTGWGTCHV
jgi:hypothetical protein